MNNNKLFEEENKSKYSGKHYNPQSITISIPEEPTGEYATQLLWEKFFSLHQYIQDGPLLDLCCGNARHLSEINFHKGLRIGADYSMQFLEYGHKEYDLERSKTTLLRADACHLPFLSGTIRTIFSFSSLYHIENTQELLSECHRVLSPKGIAVFEFGNKLSLNYICCKHYSDLAKLCSKTASHHIQECIDVGFTIKEHRCFQLFPLWADKPKWLFPLLHPAWKRVMAIRARGRMLDEWISSMPILRHFAFRHFIVCEK